MTTYPATRPPVGTRRTSGLMVGIADASIGVIYGYDSSNIDAALKFIGADFGLGDPASRHSRQRS